MLRDAGLLNVKSARQSPALFTIAIVTTVRDVRNAPPGAQVSRSIELYYLPIAALSQAPEARALKYTLVQNQVVRELKLAQ